MPMPHVHTFISAMYSSKETKSSPWFLEKKRHSPASSVFTSSSSTTPTFRYFPKFSPVKIKNGKR